MPELIAGELVAAAVGDARVWGSQGDVSPDGIYLTGQPGPVLPFVMFRAWKVPVGIVQEEVRLFGPSGRRVFRWGPVYGQAEPPALDKAVEEGLKKSDVIWVGADIGGRRKTVPAWFAYKNGKV